MPPCRRLVTLTTLLAGSCSPATFVWGDEPAEPLDRYRAAFVRAAGTRFVDSCTRDELSARLRTCRVLWLGDHHRSSRLHGLQSELLADLQRRGHRLAFALEAIGTGDQGAVQSYLDGATSMAGLREAMLQRWSGSWLDDRELDPWHYRGLLSFAQRHGLPVTALEPTPRRPLRERDALLAAAVQAAAARHADRLLVVLVGQAHLLGEGDLIARVGLPAVAIGGEPTAPLQRAAPDRAERGTLWRSEAGLWWFGELLRGADD